MEFKLMKLLMAAFEYAADVDVTVHYKQYRIDFALCQQMRGGIDVKVTIHDNLIIDIADVIYISEYRTAGKWDKDGWGIAPSMLAKIIDNTLAIVREKR